MCEALGSILSGKGREEGKRTERKRRERKGGKGRRGKGREGEEREGKQTHYRLSTCFFQGKKWHNSCSLGFLV
jgi:hypothetical protein